MTDWIEFKKNTTEKIRLRSSRIVGIHELPFDMEKNITARTLLSYEVGKTVKEYLIDEPYEQVKQKITDAEKADLSNVVVEHFTREEYETILSCVEYWKETSEWYVDSKDQKNETDKLIDKLNEILKEMK